MSKTLARIALAGLLLAAAPALAATASGTLPVSANVPPTCIVSDTAEVAFGAYDPITGGDHLGQGSISIQCTKGTAYQVALDNGSNASGTVRRMKHDTLESHIEYALFHDSGRLDAWGSTKFSDTSDGVAVNKAAVTIPVYGKISGDQDPAEGTYADSVTVTVNF